MIGRKNEGPVQNLSTENSYSAYFEYLLKARQKSLGDKWLFSIFTQLTFFTPIYSLRGCVSYIT